MTHDEMIEVIQHAKAGGKVEGRKIGRKEWFITAPVFNFEKCEYRPYVEPPKPKEIWLCFEKSGHIIACHSESDAEKTANMWPKSEGYCRMVQDGPLIDPRKE